MVRAAVLASLALVSTALADAGETTAVRLVVVTPDGPDDQPASIYCSLSTDGWPAGGRELRRVAPNLYATTLRLPAGQQVEYKFLRSRSWRTVEKGSRGEELPNRRLQVLRDVAQQVVLHQVACWADRPRPAVAVAFNSPPSAKAAPRASTLSGTIRVHEHFRSPQLDNERTIVVYLPPGYDRQPARRYPVLYMHDGNNIFDVRSSANGVEWGVDEACQRLIAQGRLQELIVVGIYNTPQRIAEYTPFVDRKYGGGRGDAYLDFLCDTVKPFVDRTYRTLPDREHTAIAGSSLGGLISIYALFERPQVFGRGAAVSPALWWADRAVLRYLRRVPPPPDLRLWIDIGTAEGRPPGPQERHPPAVRDCRALVQVLRERGFVPERDFHFEQIEGGRHHERDWAARIERVLLYLFASRTPASAPAASGPAPPGSRRGAPPATEPGAAWAGR